MSKKWRIQQLQAVTGKALDAGKCDGPQSKRVRAVPDARTIRYYTTIGLIDRPAEMRGRTAYYDRRHVLQLVCIKRLQADGLSLAEVQRQLTGITTRKLEAIAGLPKGFWESPLVAESSSPRNGSDTQTERGLSTSRARFWETEPAAADTPLEMPATLASPATVCVRLPIAKGAYLELEGAAAQQLDAATTESLRPALENLSRELARLGLIAATAPPVPRSAQPKEKRE